MSIVASTVMNLSAALLNDAALSDYTHVAQLPYLQIVLKELREFLELNNCPVTNEKSSVITVPAGMTAIGYNTIPPLPPDLIEIQRLWESNQNGQNWIPLTRQEFIPNYLDGIVSAQFGVWSWMDNAINLPTSSGVVYLKLDYIKALFTATIDENTVIDVNNADSFLIYRNAGLCAQFIGENKERADDLNAQAELARDRIVGIDNKGKQQIMTRRRPFRAGWKHR